MSVSLRIKCFINGNLSHNDPVARVACKSLPFATARFQ